MPDLASRRAAYARASMRWADAAGIAAPRVEAAFASVPREAFLPPPPWRIFGDGVKAETTSDPARLYDDVLVVLDGAGGINNGQPSLHAAWMAGVDPRPGESVIQVGTGSGYYTAILATLVGDGGRVTGYEIEANLVQLARRTLAALPQVVVRADSAVGLPLPTADIVYVAAGAAAPDIEWLRCLRPGGRLVMPWQPAPGAGRTLRVTRHADGFAARLHAAVSFVACAGAGPADVRPRGMPARPLAETRSIRLTADRHPDGSATAVYEDVWFSADPP